LLALVVGFGSSAASAAAPQVELVLEPAEATVGDHFRARLDVELPPGTRFEPETLGPVLGPFQVVSGAWRDPAATGSPAGWQWQGELVAFRTGELTLPPIRLTVIDAEGTSSTVETPERTVTVRSVLDPEAEDLAELKPPASVSPDYGPLLAGAGLLVLLLAAAAVVAWLHRRYASRLARVEPPDDPFQRTPPHVWVYGELQRLLERRLAEHGEVDRFFAELSWIVKRYLSGRYRVELMEHTTAEVPALLEQAGAPATAVRRIHALLESCDGVKFARRAPDPSACRAAIEEAYEIVDATKPAASPGADLNRGAA
jgi:hypothetical protein